MPFSWRHVPAIVMAAGNGLGGLMPYWDPVQAIRTYGFPEPIATDRKAQTTFRLYSSRATMYGAALWIFYLRGQLKAVDTLLALSLYAGAVDAYLCWSQGETGKAWFRGLFGVFYGAWGLLNLTSGESL